MGMIIDWLVPTITIAIAAVTLYFTFLKEGKILVASHTYCACAEKDAKNWNIELPLGFYNSGATGKTIMALRIRFKRDNWTSKPLYCEHILDDIGIGGSGESKDKKRKWATCQWRRKIVQLWRYKIDHLVQKLSPKYHVHYSLT
jgi:hypothetical protein